MLFVYITVCLSDGLERGPIHEDEMFRTVNFGNISCQSDECGAYGNVLVLTSLLYLAPMSPASSTSSLSYNEKVTKGDKISDLLHL